MAWNEPGKGQDPWGSGNKNSGGSGPPDLDQIWRRFRARFLGNKDGGKGNDGDGGGGGSRGPSGIVFAFLVPVVLIIWLATGLFVVQPGEKGVVMRFGAYAHTVGPGWHWHLPYPIDYVYHVDTQQVRRVSNRAVMLTKDENIVEVEVSVQYRISDAMKYLFRLRDPDATVEQVLRSAVREVVGTSSMNQVIQEGVKVEQLEDNAVKNVNLQEQSSKPKQNPDTLRNVDATLANKIKQQQRDYPTIDQRSRAMLPRNVRKIMQATLTKYSAGVNIVAVNVQYAQPPEQVQGAFQEAIKAREEEERKKNIARAYAREVVARAQGEKAQTLAEARGYKQQEISRAQGDASRFTELLTQYEKAPGVTRERLYIQSMSDVLSAANLILNDNSDGSMMYLPLQQMLEQGKRNKAAEDAANNGISTNNGLDVPMSTANSDSGSSSSTSSDFRSRSRSQ